jgi:hypothetical protein
MKVLPPEHSGSIDFKPEEVHKNELVRGYLDNFNNKFETSTVSRFLISTLTPTLTLGNWDLVGNNTPIFFIRDPILFPSFIHTQKRNPATHLKDPDAMWDFITLRPETTHQVS